MDFDLECLTSLTLLLGLDALIADLEVESASILHDGCRSHDTTTACLVHCVLVLAVSASCDLLEKR